MPFFAVFAYGAFTLCGPPFQTVLLTASVGAPTVLQPPPMP